MAAALIPPQQLDLPPSDMLHDEHTPFPHDGETLDDYPQITRTMESFKTHGVMDTIAESERKNRPQSSGPFGNRSKEGEEHADKQTDKSCEK